MSKRAPSTSDAVVAKPELAVIAPTFQPALTALEAEFVVHRFWTEAEPEQFLAKFGQRIRGVVTTGLAGFTGDQLARFPALEIVACFGVGHGTLDLVAAEKRGIVVTNTPDASADAVAELAMGALIAVERRICEADRFVRAGKWLHGAFPMGRGLIGKTCGIVGLGSIGARIAKRAEAFGMTIAYYGPRRKPIDFAYYDDLTAMARASDCLMVACPATPETNGLVDASVLSALGSDGVIVNVSRGSVVNENALVAALQEGVIAGAGLDVFADEPVVPHAFVGMEQVVLLPHIGTSTRDLREQRSALLIENLRAHFSGRAVPTPVTESASANRRVSTEPEKKGR